MINVRLKFSKAEEVKYISHLDLMRTFQRAIRRAGLPIAYSTGFNPHQEISFGAPLALGVTSSAEYVDMWLSEKIEIKDIIDRLNDTLPDGIKASDGIILSDKAKNAMSLVTHSRYTIKFKLENADEKVMNEKINSFLDQEQILIKKEQPKKNFALKEIDIKAMIYQMKLLFVKDGECFLNCLLSSGSKANLKPELLMEAFEIFCNWDIKRVKINREETYTEIEGKLVDLIELYR